VPLCPPQIPHGQTRDRTRASAVGGRRLTARAMARPFLSLQRKWVSRSVGRFTRHTSVQVLPACACTGVGTLRAYRTDVRKSSALCLWVSRFYLRHDFQKFLQRLRGHNSDVRGYRQCGQHNSHCCLCKTALLLSRTPHTTSAVSCCTYFQFQPVYLLRPGQPLCFIFNTRSRACITTQARYRTQQKQITKCHRGFLCCLQIRSSQ
jgi:hypothetical protein